MSGDLTPVQPRSRLERLPVEIIQAIFLHCLEINLPRASLHISRALSDSVIYTWLIRLAFSSANESSRHDFFTPDYLPPPLDFFALSTQERRDLQTTILECRWSTLPLIRKCQREHVKHAVRRKCLDLDLSPENSDALSKIKDRFAELPRDDYRTGRRGKGDLILRAKTRQSNVECKIAIWFHFGAFQIREHNDVYLEQDTFRLPSCTVDLPARVPEKLLCPPWTESKLEFLSLLSMDAYIDEDSTYGRSKRILRQLIRGRDFRTFERLLGFHIRVRDYNYPIRWPVLPSHFHIAVRYANERGDPFVKLLVDERWEDIPPHDLRLKDDLMTKAGTNSL
ncbi:hypothetical protein ASPWEDRAFT_35996 [Aspergillus wentii DTO 134E9]|uniref:Uncharacterized protein n=1 Tax=Aspergillus wentii DTO 134E9 TaxID=1073089 RepID=A0A1L9RTX4_ASPWE|nr:uncharacterized protein ASPWEDRAFT_35996 [Aspergillus wentii DTO 134E9]KAI9934015.1 hypothetical protein MW887_005088 [Aspergillus wentii]OJJ38380.1 hypothetical protein ASPWEDRAFT_35996 [Aspergillus wentii DTO 134E9]